MATTAAQRALLQAVRDGQVLSREPRNTYQLARPGTGSSITVRGATVEACIAAGLIRDEGRGKLSLTDKALKPEYTTGPGESLEDFINGTGIFRPK
ncbi:MAG TPA: hypothetical protein VFJ16_31270 [Longimicrobium sp.]|nr:hypothetical protein [Longimicrobium sp.]